MITSSTRSKSNTVSLENLLSESLQRNQPGLTDSLAGDRSSSMIAILEDRPEDVPFHVLRYLTSLKTDTKIDHEYTNVP